MFKKKNKMAKSSNESVMGHLANTIGKDTVLEGQISSPGNLRIDGKVKGVVESKGKVVIGPEGVLEGDLKCQNADVSGIITGSVVVEEMVILKSTASSNGDITTGKIVVEAGAKINGSLDVGGLKKVGSSSDHGNSNIKTGARQLG